MLSQVVPALFHHLLSRFSKGLWQSLGGSSHRISINRSICCQPEQALHNSRQLKQQALQFQCLQVYENKNVIFALTSGLSTKP
ncbi:hypothetical protein DUNSADRAFT_5025, partial [Dunaliella salina]